MAIHELARSAGDATSDIPAKPGSGIALLERPPLVRDEALGFGRSGTGNSIIQGDNLKVLQALQAQLRGAVRCAYLDPPYNNQERYTHYDDVLSHDAWLDMIVDRLAAIRPLLREDGSVWISIDDGEAHYLKVAADSVFGRSNFVATIVWQQRTTRENRRAFSYSHEYILVYAADARKFARSRNRLEPGAAQLERYRNPDNDPRGPWQSISANVQDGHATKGQFYEIEAPSGRRHVPPKGRCWIYPEHRMRTEIAAGNVWFGAAGNGVPRLKRFLGSGNHGITPDTLWLAADVGTSDEAKKHMIRTFPDHAIFDTPKPERLLDRILAIATDPGDTVLDPFLGSGTTSAVAERLGRRHIGIDVGTEAATLAAARLDSPCSSWPGGMREAARA